MTRKLFLIAVAVFAAIAGIVFFEVELQRFAAVRAIDGALIEHFFVELNGIAALRAGWTSQIVKAHTQAEMI